MPKDLNDTDYQERLSALIEEGMTIFPVVARKIIIASKVRSRSASSQTQNYILEMLMLGPTRPTEISRVLGISKPNVTVLLNSLITNGFVQRSHDKKDRRNVYISLTDKGKRVVQRKRKIIKNYIMSLFVKFEDTDVESFYAGMETYLDMMRKISKAIGPVV